MFNYEMRETCPQVNKLVDQYKILLQLQMLYFIVGKNNAEISFGPLQFLKLDDIIERSKIYTKILDLAVIYCGMGHVIVLSMDKNTQQFFFRPDGGSSGYEREDYFNKYIH